MKRKLLSVILALAMLCSLMLVPAAAAEPDGGNWYDGAMSTWADRGVLQGDAGGNLNPTANITRAELAVILDRIMGYQVKGSNTFADVQDGAWYADAVLKASATGVLQGDGANARPSATITRQEAMVMLARVMKLSGEAGASAGFADQDQIASWALDAVKSMAAKGYVNGSGGRIMPTANITRAEIAVMLDNMFAGYFDQAGTYTEDVDGAAVISAGGVTLENLTVSGDLIVAEGVGDGHVVLDSVALGGRLIIRGGGENSVVIKGNSKIDEVIVARQEGKVRVAVQGGAAVDVVYIDDGSSDVKVEGAVETITVSAPKITVSVDGAVNTVAMEASAEESTVVIMEDAKVDTLTTAAQNSKVTVNGTVDGVTVSESAAAAEVHVASGAEVEAIAVAAPETALRVSGTVSSVDVSETASSTGITVASGANVETVTTAADSVSLSGSGKVDTMTVTGGEGVAVDKSTTVNKVENQGAADVDVAGKDVASGETGSNKPSTGGSSSGGGGSSGPVYYTVTFKSGDTTITTQSVVSGGKATSPAADAQGMPQVAEGSKLTWYKDGEPFDLANTAITANTTLTAVVGSGQFTAGDGTAAYPYLIANAEQFVAIETQRNEMIAGPVNYRLIGTIDLSNQKSDFITYFRGVLDGNGQKIIGFSSSAEGWKSIIVDTLYDVTIQDLVLEQNGAQYTTLVGSINRFSAHVGNVTFDNVKITQKTPGTVVDCGNNDSPYCNFAFAGTTLFKDCVNEADFNFATYGALYVGGYAHQGATVNFEGCTNNGSLTGANVALFIGNPSGGPATVSVTNCTNNGLVHGVTTEGWFSKLSGSSVYDDLNSSVTVGGNPIGADTPAEIGLSIAKNEDGTLTVTAENAGSVSYYLVKARSSSSFTKQGESEEDIVSGGSSYVSIEERISASSESLTTEMPFGTFSLFQDNVTYGKEVSFDSANTEAYVGARYVFVEGENTVVFSSQDLMDAQATENEVFVTGTVNSAPRIIVEAYDASGVMLAELTVPYGELPGASSSSEDPAGA